MFNKFCIILSGPSGSGKTSLANKLWKTLPNNPAYLCLDSIKHFVIGAVGNSHYLDLARLNALSMAENFLNAGHPVIVEKAFGSYEYVRPFVEMAERLSVHSLYFKLTAPLEILIKRVEDRKNLSAEELIERAEWLRSSGNSKTVIEIFDFFNKNKHNEGIEIDTTENSIEQMAEIIRTYLSL